MFDPDLYHCLHLSQQTGKWRLIKSVESSHDAGDFIAGYGKDMDETNTRMVVVSASLGINSPFSPIFDNGQHRLSVYNACNFGAIKQPWPPRLTEEMVAQMVKDYPENLAIEQAALERRIQRDESDAQDLRMIRRERILMEEEWAADTANLADDAGL